MPLQCGIEMNQCRIAVLYKKPEPMNRRVEGNDLWSTSLQESWIKTSFTNVVSVKKPAEVPFQAQSVPTVGSCAKFSLK